MSQLKNVFYSIVVLCLFSSCKDYAAPPYYTKQISDALMRKDFDSVKIWMEKRGIHKDSIKWGDEYYKRFYNDTITPLAFSFENKMEDVSRYLLEEVHIKLDTNNNFDATLAWHACYYKDISFVKLLVENNTPIKIHNDDVYNILNAASIILKEEDRPKRKILLEYLLAGIDKPEVPYDAFDKGNTDVLRIFVKYGAKLNCETLRNACRNGDYEMIHYLIMEEKIDIECIMENENGWRPLHFAADYANYEAVKALIALGADKKARTTSDACEGPKVCACPEPPPSLCHAKGSTPLDIVNDNFSLNGYPRDSVCRRCVPLLQ